MSDGDFLCSEPGVYDLTLSCTKMVRAEVGFVSGVGWWWCAPGQTPSDDWNMVIGAARVTSVTPDELGALGMDIVHLLMERTESPTPRTALHVIGLLLRRWQQEVCAISKAVESGDWSEVTGSGETQLELLKLVET